MLKNIIPWAHCLAFAVIILFGFSITETAHAQIEKLLDNYSDEYLNEDEGFGAEKFNPNNAKKLADEYLYEQPTVKALSHMYWGLGLYSLSDNEAVDEFMRINECDMYRKFIGDEFEWGGIRDAAQSFIKNNKSQFPTRFEFMIPLKLREYNSRFSAFEVQETYKIKSFRKFELFALDAFRQTCVKDQTLASGYPRIIILELSRPLTIIRVPMSEKIANEYTRKKNKEFKRKFKKLANRTKKAMYQMRDSYLFLKVKIFAHGGLLGKSRTSRLSMVKMMGILEGYEVYADRKKETLFYSQIFVRQKKKGKLNVKLGEQYKILEELYMTGGMLQ